MREDALTAVDGAVAVLRHELDGVGRGHGLPVLRHRYVEQVAALNGSELRWPAPGRDRRFGRPTCCRPMSRPRTARCRWRWLAPARPSTWLAAARRKVPRACVNSAAWISRGMTCSVAASFAMYAERLPGSGWLLNHCGPPPRRFLLDGFEHAAEIPRVVARARHDLRAEQVGLLLVLAAVLEERRAEAELAALGDDLPPAAADHRAGDRAGDLAELEALSLGRVGCAVTQEHMAQLVGHYADDLAFTRRRLEHAAVDEHRPARKRKGVDFLEVHRRERGTRIPDCSAPPVPPPRAACRADRDNPRAPRRR